MTAEPLGSSGSSSAPDVLLVEDNPLEIELTLRPLRELDPDSRIEVARDGEEALDFLFGRGAFRHRSGAPTPRLILLDLKLPRVDGMRSEERRVGKECRYRRWACELKKK